MDSNVSIKTFNIPSKTIEWRIRQQESYRKYPISEKDRNFCDTR